VTINHLFDKVLTIVVKLVVDIIKPSDPEFRELHPRLRNARFYPYFNDCSGAMDGTHIECIVPASEMLPCAGRARLHKMYWPSVTLT
jgi:hypothetical protein